MQQRNLDTQPFAFKIGVLNDADIWIGRPRLRSVYRNWHWPNKRFGRRLKNGVNCCRLGIDVNPQSIACIFSGRWLTQID